jgi:hypothetical protein
MRVVTNLSTSVTEIQVFEKSHFIQLMTEDFPSFSLSDWDFEDLKEPQSQNWFRQGTLQNETSLYCFSLLHQVFRK